MRVHEFTVEERIMENIISITTIKQVIDKTIKVKVNKIVSPRDVSLLAHSLIGDSDREYFLVIHVSTKNRVNSVDIAHIGSLNTCTIHPREILKGAILSNSAAIVLAHNHPSLDLTPSHEDIQFTKRMQDASQIMGIDLLDHLIVNQNQDYYSMKEFNHIP